MANSETGIEFDAVLVDEDHDGDVPLGRVALSLDGMLSVVQAGSRERAVLETVVASVNAKPCMHVRTPSAPNAGASSVSSRPVQRSEPAFVGALVDYVARYHDLRLTLRADA